MSSFLEYRPQYTYKRELEAILRSYEITDAERQELMGHGPSEKEEHRTHDLKHLIDVTTYKPAPVVHERFALTPTDIYSGLVSANDSVQELIDLIKVLPDSNSIKKNRVPSIEEYIQAKESLDADNIYIYEDHHEENIDNVNSTAKEVLPLLIAYKKETETIAEVVVKFFPPSLESLPSEGAEVIEALRQNMEPLRKEESESLILLVEKDRTLGSDKSEYNQLNYENHILKSLDSRLTGTQDFAEEVKHIVVEKITERIGLFESIAKLVAETPSLKKPLDTTNALNFATHKMNLQDARQRMDRIVDTRYKVYLYEETKIQQELKLEMQDLMETIYNLDEREEDDQVNIFLFDQLDSIEKVVRDSESLLDDLYRMAELEELQEVDYLTSLSKKADCRIISGIIEGRKLEDEDFGRGY